MLSAVSLKEIVEETTQQMQVAQTSLSHLKSMTCCSPFILGNVIYSSWWYPKYLRYDRFPPITLDFLVGNTKSNAFLFHFHGKIEILLIGVMTLPHKNTGSPPSLIRFFLPTECSSWWFFRKLHKWWGTTIRGFPKIGVPPKHPKWLRGRPFFVA